MADLLSQLIQIADVALNGVWFFSNRVLVNTPYLLLIFGIFFLGACIGIFGRLLSRG